MTHCSRCGGLVVERVPPGEDRPRAVCDACGAIHYQNPRVVVGAATLDADGRVLLARRAIEPRRGAWTIPAGFLELGESAPAGARRETREETGAIVDIVAPLVHFDLLRIGQIYLMYRATLVDGSRLGEAATRSESLEVGWFALDALPWDELAFDAVKFTLELLRGDLARGELALHYGSIEPIDPARSGPFGMNRLEERWSLKLGPSV